MSKKITEAEWIAALPERVRIVAEKLGASCVRSKDGRGGHYRIGAYSEHDGGEAIRAGAEVTLTLSHGADSFLPGFAVFGIKPEEVERCGCGEWRPPTESQKRFARARVAAWRADGQEPAEGV